MSIPRFNYRERGRSVKYGKQIILKPDEDLVSKYFVPEIKQSLFFTSFSMSSKRLNNFVTIYFPCIRL